jgi:NAD(P)-dependent dehydrogenase (short-subunit alcohol dehydrogenase family)
MGETTAFHLAKVGYHVYAGVYMKESFKKYESLKNVTPVQVDVADEGSVENAAKEINEHLEKSKGSIKGLYGVLQCAGIAYTGRINCIILVCCLTRTISSFRIYPHGCIQETIRSELLRLCARRKSFPPHREEV